MKDTRFLILYCLDDGSAVTELCSLQTHQSLASLQVNMSSILFSNNYNDYSFINCNNHTYLPDICFVLL